MTDKEPDQPQGRGSTEQEDRLLWRTALGQATYDLLTDGREVTVKALMDRLQQDEASTTAKLRRKSVRAALSVLREIDT